MIKNKKVIAAAVAAAVVILIACVAIFGPHNRLPESFAGEIDISPVYASEYGVGAKQGFVITSAEPLTDELIKSSLILTPSFEYTLKKEDGGKTFIVEPKLPLLADTVYQIGMDPERALVKRGPRASNTWAFQTEADFRLLGCIPTDQGTDVPVNTVLRFTFTQAVDANTAGSYISVNPEIDGRWESKGEQLTFVPKNDLSMDTVYTVSVKGGLPNLAKDAELAESREFQFQTKVTDEDGKQAWFQIENDNNCFRTDEIPAFRYYNGWQADPVKDFDVEIYKFADESGYIEAMRSRQPEYYWCYADDGKILDTGKLTKVSAFSINDFKGTVLRSPESIDAGFYLADFKAGGIQRQSLFQVTDISGYFAAGNKDSLVWLNDQRTGQPLSGAEVTLYREAKSRTDGTEAFTTDKSGVAVLTGEMERNQIISVRSGSDRLVMNGYSYSAGYGAPAINPYDYWYYMSTDRQIYHPGDTLNYFGIMAPRSGQSKEFTEAELVLSGGAYYGDSAIRQKVRIEDGIISGSWELPVLKSDWYSLSIQIDGQSFGYAGFEVNFYEKPAYRFTIESDKAAVFAGEQVKWSVHAGYFEGTPVAGLPVNIWHDGIEEKASTGGEGDVTVSYAAPPPNSIYLTGSSYITVSAVMPELGNVNAYGSVVVFNNDTDIDGRVKRDGRSFNLHIDGFDVNLDGINEGGQVWRGEYRRPLTGRVSLHADLTRVEYDKIKNGPYYNEYTLQTYYTYDYSRREVPENSYGFTLDSGGIDFTGELETDASYELVINGQDHKGRPFTRTYYIPENTRNYGELAVSEEEDFWGDFDWSNYYRYFYISEINNDGWSYSVGDELKFMLSYGNLQVPKPDKGNILYFRSQETIRDYALSEDGAYEMKFEERDVPNVNLTAVCFDGKYYVESDARYISLDPADKAAKVAITTDKQRYAPGETVDMSLNMTDKDGTPLAGTVNVSIVDEALFALAENYVDIGYSVFSNKYSYPYTGTVSHMPVASNQGGAEMGDGGGEREDFRDTALFKTIQTDAKGHAALSFKLPDNITSWRITWQAYSPGIYVGNGSQNIDASLDFFLDYRIAKIFLTGDEPKIGLRSAGRGIDALKSQTSYTVEIPQLNYTGSTSGPANEWRELALPKLSEGKYQVKISAQNGKYQDAVNMEFSVIESFASYQVNDEVKLTAATRPTGSKTYPTVLVFSDKTYADALSGLYNLAWRNGIRLEQKLVSRIASDMLADDLGVETYAASDEEKRAARDEIIKYQQGNGGVASFTYSEADIETSVLAASVGGDYFDRDALSSYFYNYLADESASPVERTFALWGLAALREPVLVEIQKTLDSPALSGEEKLNLAMALYFAGDGAKAKILAKEIIASFTEDLGSEIRANIDADDKASQTKATARLALLASVFDLPQEDGLVRYMQNNTYDGDYYLMEKMGISQNRLSRLPEGDAKFTYSLGGATKTVDLRNETVYSLSVLPEQLDEIGFSGVSGDITLLSCYTKEGRVPDGGAAAGQLTIKRAINGNYGDSVTVEQGKPVKVQIDFWIAADAPNGCYTITDMLPAGLRFGNVESYRYWYARVGGNGDKEVEFSIYKTDYNRYSRWRPDYYQPDGSLKGRIVYTAFPVMTGSFTVEAPRFGHSLNDNIMIHATETGITIE